MALVVKAPSVTVKVTAELPATVGVPEISPVTASILNPAGRPLALTLAPGVPWVVITWKLKRCPTLKVALVPLIRTGPEAGAGCTVSERGRGRAAGVRGTQSHWEGSRGGRRPGNRSEARVKC